MICVRLFAINGFWDDLVTDRSNYKINQRSDRSPQLEWATGMRSESRNLKTACLIEFFGQTSWVSVSLVLPLYTTAVFHASVVDIGLIMSTAFAMAMIFRIPASLLIGRRGKYVLFAGLAISAIAPLVYTLAYDVRLVLAVRVLQGLGAAILPPIMLSLISLMSSPRYRGRDIGRYTIAVPMGMIAGSAMTAVVIAAYGMSETFTVNTAIGFVALLLALIFLARSDAWAFLKRPTPGNLMPMLTKKPLLGCFSAFFLFAILYGAILSFLPLYLTEKFSAPASTVTAVFTAYFVFMAAVRLFLSRLMVVLDNRTLLMLGFASAIAAVAVLFLTGDILLVALAFVMLGFCHGIVYPITAIIVSETVSPADLAFANSVLATSFDLGNTVGPITMGLIAESYGIAFALLSTSLTSLVAILAIHRTLITE